MIQKTYVDAQGNGVTRLFSSAEKADKFPVPPGMVEQPEQPTREHKWRNGAWVIPEPSESAPEIPEPRNLEAEIDQLKKALTDRGLVTANELKVKK